MPALLADSTITISLAGLVGIVGAIFGGTTALVVAIMKVVIPRLSGRKEPKDERPMVLHAITTEVPKFWQYRVEQSEARQTRLEEEFASQVVENRQAIQEVKDQIATEAKYTRHAVNALNLNLVAIAAKLGVDHSHLQQLNPD